ncbi:MAG: tetratricopeptide repeat protein [Candidatus Obscuribacterales bacterium]
MSFSILSVCISFVCVFMLWPVAAFASPVLSAASETAESFSDDGFQGGLRLAKTLLSERHYPEAEQGFRQVIDDSVRLRLDSARLADLFNFLGVTLHCQHKDAEAIESYRRALSGLPEGLTADTRGKIYSNLALSYSALGRRREALQACRSALDHFRLCDVDALTQSVLLNTYGQLLIDSKNWGGAEAILVKSLQLRSSVVGESVELALPLLKLAEVYQEVGKEDLAEELLRRRSYLLEEEVFGGATIVQSSPDKLGFLELSGNIRQDHSKFGNSPQARKPLRRATF